MNKFINEIIEQRIERTAEALAKVSDVMTDGCSSDGRICCQ